jgi:dipeptidyl aminopeptidase/acylaminoacyl peptidase
VSQVGRVLLMFAAMGCIPQAPAADTIDLEPWLRREGFVDVKLSPDGEYLAATVAREDQTVLAVIRRSDRKATASFSVGANTHVSDFEWVSADRLIVSVAEKFGVLETPIPTGELYALNVDGSRAKLLVGLRATGDEEGEIVGERFNPRAIAAYLLDPLPKQPRHVLIEAWPLTLMPTPRVERMDIHTGKRTPVAEAPLPRAHFTTDADGNVRFALGMAGDNVSKLYHRAADGKEWTLVNDESATGIVESPVGFDASGRIAYLRTERPQGPDALIAYDTSTRTRKELLRDAQLDPWTIIRSTGPTREPIGVAWSGATVRSAFFDTEHPEALRHRSLEKGFAGLPVLPVSASDDARFMLALSWSAQNPGDYFLFDTESNRAERLLSRRAWIDPAQAADVLPVRLEARDGLALDGFMTRPRGSDGKLPLVVMPHGGPFGVFDRLSYDDDAQLLAAAGYAVLQVNFRGSGNRGRAFREAGARQWGARMQDDVTDATRWAIAEGIADPERICLVGGSYGAYAAMMGLAREPELYRCAVGYVGVYDLAMMAEDRVRRGESAETWVSEWVGEGDALRAASATTHAGQIKDPVLLVAGGRDRIAPPAHTRAMENALERAGVDVDTLYVATEGHGFFAQENRRAYATRMLAFLAEHLGGKTAR